MKTGRLIKRIYPYFTSYKKIMALDLACASLTTLCEIILPLIVRKITDTAINDFAALTASMVLKCGALYVVLRIIDAFANYYMSNTGHVMGAKIETDMRRDLFAHLSQLSLIHI